MIKKLMPVLYTGLLTACFSASAIETPKGGMSFSKLDANGDDKIALHEFVDKIPKRRRSPEDIFQKLDSNGDGFLDQDEFDARANRRGRR